MKCPKDDGSLKSIFTHDMEVDVCMSCGGIWLDHTEFEKAGRYFTRGGEYAELTHTRLASPKTHSSNWIDRSDSKRCPVDGVAMEVFHYAGNSKIYLNQCPKCHGFWCDGGELLAIQEHLKPNRKLDDVFKSFIHEMQDTENEKKELASLPAKVAYAGVALLQSPLYLIFLIVSFAAHQLTKERR